MAIHQGAWHGKARYFGLHYDLHANVKDLDLGMNCAPETLVPMLQLMAPDFVQTDCKGHAGYTSWYSRVPDAAVPPALKQDAMRQWRDATAQLGLPLHCHYSGIWDKAAGERHPEWAVVGPEGAPTGAPFGQNAGAPTPEKMCPRGPYLEQLMIPQMIELIDRYQVDGFWIDGDLWSVEPCYCERCRSAFARATGILTPPTKVEEPEWATWWNFTRESFYAFVTRYCDAVHKHKPGVLVCSNWLQTFANPGEPKVPTDWISGDNSWIWGLDGSRCEARFLSTRGKPWDIMLWSFLASHGMGQPDSPWTFKPAEMIMQECAVLLAYGGNVQIYEHPPMLRDGSLVPWRQRRLQAVGQFVKARQALSQGGTSQPQVAILHSEVHLFARPSGKNLMWNVDTKPVKGGLFGMLETQHSVDVLDEWALLPRLAEFPVVVVPEQEQMSDLMVEALKAYVKDGGRLFLTGAAMLGRFGTDFLGVTADGLAEKLTCHIAADDGATPMYSETWQHITPAVNSGARAIKVLLSTPLLDERFLPHPAAVIHAVGKGQVLYAPFNLFRFYAHNRYPLTRELIRELAAELTGTMDLDVARAPTSIDFCWRRQGARHVLHLVNRTSGTPTSPNNGAIDEIPSVGPLHFSLALPATPVNVAVAYEDGSLTTEYRDGRLHLTLSHVQIHTAIVID